MEKDSTGGRGRKWFDSGHASLCLLGSYLRRIGFFQPLEQAVRIQQKVLKYTPAQKLELRFVSLLAGAKAVSHTGTSLRVDPALQVAFGLPGCAEQSTIADTLDAATAQDVADLRRAVEAIFVRHSRARRHDFAGAILTLDLDLSPAPASAKAEGSERGFMGRSRSKTGRKLVRVRAAAYQETVWEEVRPGKTAEGLSVLREAVLATERLLGLDGDGAEVLAKRARTAWRLDSGWGGEEAINWLLARGYPVTGKFKAWQRVAKLVAPIQQWEPTSSAGREVAVVPAPVELVRPTRQYAVRTPSDEKKGGYYSAVLFSSRADRTMAEVVDHYDGRAGMEADLKGDQRGLGLTVLRKRKLAAQQVVVLLVGLAHHVLIWARRWLGEQAPRLAGLGIVRLVREVWAVPGRIKLAGTEVRRVRLNRDHPRARDLVHGFRQLLPPSQTLALLG